MAAGKEVIYMVTYLDDKRRKHITFVEGLSAVRFLQDRFDSVKYEATIKYRRAIV